MLGDLNPNHFLQNADGAITLNPDFDLPSDRRLRYTSGADAFTGTVELFDSSMNVVVWSMPVENQYSTQGKYLGSIPNHNLVM
jgi:hypothetical protein